MPVHQRRAGSAFSCRFKLTDRIGLRLAWFHIDSTVAGTRYGPGQSPDSSPCL